MPLPKAFNLVLTGKVAAGHTREAAAAALSRMMRVTEERALELLAGSETVIKRNLDGATLARYLGALAPIGVEVRADEIREAPAAAPPQANPHPSPAAAETVKCPACGTEQPKRNLCRQCGGDIRRLLAAASAPPEEASSTSMGRGVASLRGTVRTESEVFTPHPLNAFSLAGRVGRLRYLAYSFPAYLPLIGAAVVGGLLGGLRRSMGVFAIFMIVGGLATMWLGVRIAVLRLHDLNRSGKWVLLPLVPLLAIFTRSPVLMIGSSLFMLLGMVALCVWPGSMMSNDYGPSPGPNTVWTIVGAVLFILLCIIGGFSGGPAHHAGS